VSGNPDYDGDGWDYPDDDCDLDELDCSRCGGDAYVECDDPIQCCARHVDGMCPCGACGGTGLRKNQVIF
jgi:hypothetical protein